MKDDLTQYQVDKVISGLREFIFQHGLESGNNVIDIEEANLDSKFLVADLVDIILETEPT